MMTMQPSDPTYRPCGCHNDWPCQCSPESITERGTFARSCRACGIGWDGHRHYVMQQLQLHCRTEEHKETYLARAADMAEEDAENRRLIAGRLW